VPQLHAADTMERVVGVAKRQQPSAVRREAYLLDTSWSLKRLPLLTGRPVPQLENVVTIRLARRGECLAIGGECQAGNQPFCFLPPEELHPQLTGNQVPNEQLPDVGGLEVRVEFAGARQQRLAVRGESDGRDVPLVPLQRQPHFPGCDLPQL